MSKNAYGVAIAPLSPKYDLPRLKLCIDTSSSRRNYGTDGSGTTQAPWPS